MSWPFYLLYLCGAGDEKEPVKKKVVYASKKRGPKKQPSGDAGAAAEAEAAKQAETEAVAAAQQQAKVGEPT